MNNQRYKYFGVRFSENDKKKLYDIEEEIFSKKYREMLEVVKNNTTDLLEKERVSAILENRSFVIQTNFVEVVK